MDNMHLSICNVREMLMSNRVQMDNMCSGRFEVTISILIRNIQLALEH